MTIIDSKVSKVLEVNKHLSLPLGLSSATYEAFKCSICLQSPLFPPIIIGKCCKRILGCQKCVDEWFRGEDRMTKRCPLCQGERGFADTMILLGLEEFLKTIASISATPTRDEGRVPPPPTVIPSIPSDISSS